MILSDEVSGKIDRVCCGAVKIFMGNKSSPFCTFLQDRVCVAMKAPVGLLSGRAVLRSKMEGHCPDKLGGICDKEYHGLRRASRWFCKFYCRNAVIVGLIARRSSAFPFNQCISAFWKPAYKFPMNVVKSSKASMDGFLFRIKRSAYCNEIP